MSSFTGIVAHLIVGRKPEPYLTAVLESIADVCDHAVVNDNSGIARGANSEVVLNSRLALAGRLTLVRSSFVDFATARNTCLDATPREYSRAWGLFVDADEVHGNELKAMAALLPFLPDDIEAVDGYSRFFVGSFDWWTELQRSRCFFRLSPHLRWSGRIHERLDPVHRRIALPAQWFQYGHVVMPREEAQKSRLYASLGPGAAPTDAQVACATPASVWAELLRKANRYRGQHPLAMAPVISAIRRERRDIFKEVDALALRQTSGDRLRNTLRQANASRLIAWRAAEARLRLRWPDDPRYHSLPKREQVVAPEIAIHVGRGAEGRFANQPAHTGR
ncbi:MAG TPA: hypothetical protein VGW96_06365 [Candidatus Eremiobacteraceae bacterium]|nr:hypothetical protein [Candidatus Eremiobacteraceae bacterium]